MVNRNEFQEKTTIEWKDGDYIKKLQNRYYSVDKWKAKAKAYEIFGISVEENCSSRFY